MCLMQQWKLGTCEVWNGKIWCGESLAHILEYHGNIRYKVPGFRHKNTHTPPSPEVEPLVNNASLVWRLPRVPQKDEIFGRVIGHLKPLRPPFVRQF